MSHGRSLSEESISLEQLSQATDEHCYAIDSLENEPAGENIEVSTIDSEKVDVYINKILDVIAS